jgi:hypothetical protein
MEPEPPAWAWCLRIRGEEERKSLTQSRKGKRRPVAERVEAPALRQAQGPVGRGDLMKARGCGRIRDIIFVGGLL